MNDRRADIDWLRIAATFLLFFFHAGKVFDPAPFFHIRNEEVSFVFTIFCGFIGIWHMPLFFLLAGWSAAASLRSRGRSGFLRERGRRLAIPFVAACVLLGPVMKYFELRSGLDLSHRGLRMAPHLRGAIRELVPGGLESPPPFHESFLEFLPTFFAGLERFTWGHLWFVAYLLVLTVALLPVMSRLLRAAGTIATPRTWMIYAPVAPLVLVQLLLRPIWPSSHNLYSDWADMAYFATFVLAGFALATQPSLEALVARQWRRSLAAGTAAASVLLLTFLGVLASQPLMLAASAVASWCFVVGIVGAGRGLSRSTGDALGYLSEAAFPVYVLHQPVLIMVGFPLLALPLGIAGKYVLLVASSSIATMTIYHLLVRPLALPRVLLGMKLLEPGHQHSGTSARAERRREGFLQTLPDHRPARALSEAASGLREPVRSGARDPRAQAWAGSG